MTSPALHPTDRHTIEAEILQLHEKLGHELARPPVSPEAELRRKRYMRDTMREIRRLQHLLAVQERTG